LFGQSAFQRVAPLAVLGISRSAATQPALVAAK